MDNIQYIYKNAPIPGGGYVTGFLFSPVDKDTMYIRTDIGGTYKYDCEEKKFYSLINQVGMENLSETFPMGIATSKSRKGSLYIASGINGHNGRLSISNDYGKSFKHRSLPCNAHGNLPGRGTGSRLVVDDATGDILFASPKNGLFLTHDEGHTWTKLDVNGEEHCTFVFIKPGTDTLIVGTAGVNTKESDIRRGHSLYISYDRGCSFEKISEPEGLAVKSRMAGVVAHRYAYDGKYFYVTMNQTGEYAYIVEDGYSSDCGQVIGGVVLRYSFDENGRISEYELISPEKDYINLRNGYGGIDASKVTEGLLILSTITRNDGDVIYRSWDYGTTWEKVLEGLKTGKISFYTPYMKPCYNGNASLIHWLTDVKFNPFNDDEAWFNTGTGVFGCENFKEDIPHFHDKCSGIEETVHLNLYAPPTGEVQLIDILGDLGGFAFTDLNKPCENSFADENGNRYITCINADYSDYHPECVVVTPRGNWTGKTKGGLIISHDQCKTFERVSLPYGMSEELDAHFRAIETPNVNSGWVAMSSDTKNIVWSVADGITLPNELVIVSNDGGKSWKKVETNSSDKFFKVYADRVDPMLFFGFTDNGNIYVSTDGGCSFALAHEDGSFKHVNFGLIDCANKTEIRFESGKSGVFYLVCGPEGLWKLEFNKTNGEMMVKRLSNEGDVFFRMGLGIIRKGSDYFKDNKAIYVSAIIDGVYGFYRSFDDGKSFEKLNDKDHLFGEINSLEADKRTFGRFFIATGSRGVIYGEEA